MVHLRLRAYLHRAAAHTQFCPNLTPDTLERLSGMGPWEEHIGDATHTYTDPAVSLAVRKYRSDGRDVVVMECNGSAEEAVPSHALISLEVDGVGTCAIVTLPELKTYDVETNDQIDVLPGLQMCNFKASPIVASHDEVPARVWRLLPRGKTQDGWQAVVLFERKPFDPAVSLALKDDRTGLGHIYTVKAVLLARRAA